MLTLDLTDAEKQLLRGAINSIVIQLNAAGAKTLVSLAEKINALIPEPKDAANG
jgi:hypothetical protein